MRGLPVRYPPPCGFMPVFCFCSAAGRRLCRLLAKMRNELLFFCLMMFQNMNFTHPCPKTRQILCAFAHCDGNVPAAIINLFYKAVLPAEEDAAAGPAAMSSTQSARRFPTHLTRYMEA